MSDQHTRGFATDRHRSLVERCDRKAVARDVALQTQKKVRKTDIQKKKFEHIELPGKPLDYFLRSNKSNINQYQRLQAAPPTVKSCP